MFSLTILQKINNFKGLYKQRLKIEIADGYDFRLNLFFMNLTDMIP